MPVLYALVYQANFANSCAFLHIKQVTEDCSLTKKCITCKSSGCVIPDRSLHGQGSNSGGKKDLTGSGRKTHAPPPGAGVHLDGGGIVRWRR